jgi:uncharacterized protein (TIGR03435 family)
MRCHRTMCALVCLGAWSIAISAQAPTPPVWPTTFDVASVKLSPSSDRWSSYYAAGRWTVTGMPLRRLIAHTYDIGLPVERYLLVGGADRILDRSFDIRATTSPDVPEDQIRPMIRNLLAERFRLRVRWDERPAPVYALLLARPDRFGPELRRSAHNCRTAMADLAGKKEPPSDANRPRDAKGRPLCWPVLGDQRPVPGVLVTRKAGSIADLIGDVQPYLDRPVVDASGLQGNFEWQITTSMRGSDTDDVPRSMDVALSRQLGITLKGQSAPVRALVIDSVEMPTPD